MISATMCSGASSTSWYVALLILFARALREAFMVGLRRSGPSKAENRTGVLRSSHGEFQLGKNHCHRPGHGTENPGHQPCIRFRHGRVRLGSRDRPGHIRRLVTCLPNYSGPFAFQASGLQFTDGLGVIKTGAHAGDGISTGNDGTNRGKPATSEDRKPGTASAVVMHGFPCDRCSPRPCGLPFRPDSALARRLPGAGSGAAAGSDLSPIQQYVVGQNAGHHRFTNRNGPDADTRVMAPLRDNLRVVSVPRNRPSRQEDR